MVSSASMAPSLEVLNEPEYISSGSRFYVEKLLNENAVAGPVTMYLDLAMELLVANPSKVPLECILEVVAGVPKLASILLPKLDVFKALQHHNKEDVRELVAQIISVVVCETLDDVKIDAFVHDLSRNVKDKQLEQQHGSVLTLGYTIGRIVRRHLTGPLPRKELEQSCRDSLSGRLSAATCCIVDFLFDTHPMITSAACLAIGEMGRCGPLLDSDPSRAVEKLIAIINDNKMNGKIREKAAFAAGYLSLGQLDYPKRRYVIEHFLQTAQVG